MTHPLLADLKIKIFADGADLAGMTALAKDPMIQGFTTNPTLMAKVGIKDYAGFARQVLAVIPDRPVSFEVFADDFPTMEAQGRVIKSWGANVYVKVPVMNTKGETAYDLIRTLSAEGVQLNVTALFTMDQVTAVADALSPDTAAVVSVFAGRVADTGIDPVPLMKAAKAALVNRPKAELLWASPREVLNLFQANDCGTDIITMAHDQLAKLKTVGKDLTEFSRETVEMFYRDATAAGFSIET